MNDSSEHTRSHLTVPKEIPVSENLTDPIHPDEKDPVREDDVSSRVDRVMKEQELIAVEHAEAETEQQKKRQRAELADHRSKLLKAVRVEAPDLATPLFEKLTTLASENHEFAPREVVDLLKAHKARFKDEPDFFDLGIAQREDLLDRVGFYRGIVIDHSLSNPVESGFRDVLMRGDDSPLSPAAGLDKGNLKKARLLYRKPNFSGYFENYYTTSETVYQAQKNGLTNLSVSLGVAGGKFGNSVALGASLSKYGSQEESSSFVGKKVYTTANFFLPKIELSFENNEACASLAFCEACNQAVNVIKSDTEDKFRRLQRVLNDFGHFVPLQTLVGGRLFATEKKLFQSSESSSDFTNRFGLKVKASLSTVYADAEISGGFENSSQEAIRKKETSEMQTMTFNAIGGEGTVVQDAAAWAESLYDYRRWASVQRENLVPSINLLPEELRNNCWQVLKDFCEARSKREILNKHKASFLFYGEYGEEVGWRAREVYFSIENRAYNGAVTARTVPPSESGKIVLLQPQSISSQLWSLSEHGHLILRSTDRRTAHGLKSVVSFTLTVDYTPEAGGPSRDDYPVMLCQLSKDREKLQLWDAPGSGELICRALGPDYVLFASDNKTLCMKKRGLAGALNHLWYFDEVPACIESDLRDYIGDEWVQIWTEERDAVLSISNAEHLATIDSDEQYHVVAQPDIGGLHQFWRRESSGRITSLLKDVSGNALILTANDKTDRLVASKYLSEMHQKWTINSDKTISPNTGQQKEKVLTVYRFRDTLHFDRGAVVNLKNDASLDSQHWILEPTGLPSASALPFRHHSYSNSTSLNDVSYVDENEVDIVGELKGIQFYTELNSEKRCVLRLKAICAVTENGEEKEITVTSVLGKIPLTPLIRSSEDRKTYIEQNLVYLPHHSPCSISLNASNSGNRERFLKILIKAEEKGKWLSYWDNTYPQKQVHLESSSLRVTTSGVKINNGEKLVALGIGFEPDGQVLIPRLLASREEESIPLKVTPEIMCGYPVGSDVFINDKANSLSRD